MTETTPGRLGADLHDPELVAQAPPDRQQHPEQRHHPRGGRPDQDPQVPDQGMADERDTGGDLVEEREREAEVEVQVDDPPGLIPEPLLDDPHRGDPGHHEQPEPREGGEHVRVGDKQHPHFMHRPGPCRLRVAERDQHDMRGDEAECPRADLAVPADQPILPGRALQPGQPRYQHHHDQHEVSPAEAGEPASGRQQPAGRTQRPG